MERNLLQKLIGWKGAHKRKPLLLNGARQVGKTYLLQDFGAKCFVRTHYCNFEKEPSLHALFEPNLDPHRIINALNFYLDTAINITTDFVIFDEIQACPLALTSLKYFCEEMPQLALACAGSLLGLQLGAGSFPVGKVDMLTLHSMSFSEFLQATDDKAAALLQTISLPAITLESSIPPIVHQHLWQQLKHYFIVGGLPEAVAIYQDKRDDLYSAFNAVRTKQTELIKAYYSDIAKHAGKVNAMHIDRLWNAIPAQLARQQDGSASKFKFKGIVPGINRYLRLVNVIDWLQATGLIIKIHVAHSGLQPLQAYTKENFFKLFMFDIGILGAMSQLQPKAILEYDYATYKGYFAENFIAQEFLCAGVPNLYSWHEQSAEVEFLYAINNTVVPIEVKSGWVTKAKSLGVFAEKYQPPYRVIMSAKNLILDKRHRICHCPIYLANQMIAWLKQGTR